MNIAVKTEEAALVVLFKKEPTQAMQVQQACRKYIYSLTILMPSFKRQPLHMHRAFQSSKNQVSAAIFEFQTSTRASTKSENASSLAHAVSGQQV